MDHLQFGVNQQSSLLQGQQTRPRRGRLKIFFGAAPGVGKTYAMLDAAQLQRGDGVDVVIGAVDMHARPEMAAMVLGLPVIQPRIADNHGTQVEELDLDSVLARKPALVLVDDLAHTNAPGARHARRWQDVEELLEAGIDVYSTVDVQRLESLRDVVSQITGLAVTETVPDSILEQADEVELIDLPPDDLLQRLEDGKVYLPRQADYAERGFFRKGNLMALRELALRATADRVDKQMQLYRRDHEVAQTWPATERLLVCVGPGPLAMRLVRAAKRMAASLHAEWVVLYVETPTHLQMPEIFRERVNQTLRLAEQLGAETVTLHGHNLSEEIVAYARKRNVSRIIVGKPVHPRWRDYIFGSVLNDLVRNSGEIDVYAISGDPEQDAAPPSRPTLQRTSSWFAYGQALAVVTLFTLVAWLMFPHFSPSSLIMVYLLGVVIVAVRYGRGPSILASILSVAAFDFFFVTPYLTFEVSDSQYIVTFGVMLLVAVTISTLTVRIKQQAVAAREREQRNASLYALSRELASSRGSENLLRVATRHIRETFESLVNVFLSDADGTLSSQKLEEDTPGVSEAEQGKIRWVFEHSQAAGLGTETFPHSQGLYLPLVNSRGTAGVVGVYPRQSRRLFSPEQRHLLETFVSQAALAIERARLAEETERARMQIETEQLRNSLLSSVSHDLRTPLASITGAVSSLLESEATLEPEARHELAQVAYEEAERLNRLVSNLLEMTRLESGGVRVEKEWQPLEEVVGVTLNRLEKRLKDRPLRVELPPDLPLVPLDSVLIEQVLINLLENAIKYTPPGSPIDLTAHADPGQITVEIADRGPGLAPGAEQHVFDKFYRTRPTTAAGVGLGLTICRGIVKAHGGQIWAENRDGGGALFRFTLPLEGTPPEVATEDE